jgi:type VI secretion system protein
MARSPLFVHWARTGAFRRGSYCVALLAVLLLAAGCHLFKVSSWFGGSSKLEVASVSPRMNHNSPVAVEVVFVYDQGVLDQLLAMDAKTWFAQREQIIRDHASQGALDSWKWEWVPGQSLQTIPAVPLEYKTGTLGGVIFASYSTPGSHRQRIDPQLDILLTLGETDLTVKQES